MVCLWFIRPCLSSGPFDLGEGVLIKLLDPATCAIGIDVKRISECSNSASVKQFDHMFVTVGTQDVCLFKIPPP
jgi:hypothetical protein